jgi:hypothetical protein
MNEEERKEFEAMKAQLEELKRENPNARKMRLIEFLLAHEIDHFQSAWRYRCWKHLAQGLLGVAAKVLFVLKVATGIRNRLSGPQVIEAPVEVPQAIEDGPVLEAVGE